MVSEVMYSSKRSDWQTPQGFFDKLNAEFDFKIDAAASEANALCKRYYDGGKHGDALHCAWDKTTFCNPPYSRNLGDWLLRGTLQADKYGVVVVFLIPARTSNPWWHDVVMAYAREVRFIRGRIRFVGAQYDAPFPSCIVVFDGNYRGECKYSSMSL